jgi:glutamate N-acetyltransferase/amino-acid acetyltransferase
MIEKIEGGVIAAKGFKAAGVYAGLKKARKDMALLYTATPAVVAGTFTTNKVKAAPVLFDKAVVDSGNAVKAVVINSKNANACTGEKGMSDCEETAEYLAEKLGINKAECLIASTGVIGVPLPMKAIKHGIDLLAENLGETWEYATAAAESIMTTDTVKKEIAFAFTLGGKECHIGGMAKGAGMIHPNMATTLSFVTTDAAIEKKALQTLLGATVEDTFNMISVDGDTSTNDTCLVLSNGLAGNEELTLSSPELAVFKEALNAVLEYLAKELVRDGEGATRFIEVKLAGAKTKKDAKVLARAIVSSSLFKAAIFGSDANWGRALCAMGYSGADFNPDSVELWFASDKGCIKVLEKGVPLAFDEAVAKTILLEKAVTVVVECNDGNCSAASWGCDLTYDYVKINGDYRS